MKTNYEKALELIEIYHKGQMYGDKPYTEAHLIAGVQVALKKFHFHWVDNEVLAAYLLHDILEDTSITYDELRDEVGGLITAWVYRVTDGEGKNRKERKAAMYAKTGGHLVATYIKLLDRYMNVQSPKLRDMYRKEHKVFKEKLYFKNENLDEMWDAIEEILYGDSTV